jgi:hypothetical protein
MTQLLQSLTTGRDQFETIGDLIAQILANEIANQRALAVAAGEPSGDWAVAVYREAASPWEFFTEDPTLPPVVSIRFARFDMLPAETTITQQIGTAQYFLDFAAAGLAEGSADGQTPGDFSAAVRVQQAVRLIRRILCASINQYLQARGSVGWRRVTSFEMFQPPQLTTTKPPWDFVAAARLILEVKIRETSPEYEAPDLEQIFVALKKGQDGAILAQMDYTYEMED